MRSTLRLFAAPLAALLLAGCAADGAGGSIAAAVPGAADVTTEDLARSMVDAEEQDLLAPDEGGLVTTASTVDTQARILTQLVVLSIFQDAADDAGVSVTDADVEAEMEARGETPSFLIEQLVRRELLQDAIVEEIGEAGFQLLLDGAIELDVQVDPRFGTWSPQAGVVPPT